MKLLNFFFPLKLKSSGMTDKGQKRALNEDYIYYDDERGLYLVADGIGGHGNGDYASQETVKIIEAYLDEHIDDSDVKGPEQLTNVSYENAGDIGSKKFYELNHIIDAIELSNEKIFKENQIRQAQSNKKGMGTTLSGCWFLPKKRRVVLFNCGDSRVYQFRNHQLIQKSHDHSMRQHWIDNGRVGPKPAANIILRAIGPRDTVVPDIELADMRKGDTWLICSDGLHGMIPDRDIQEFLTNRLSNKKLPNHENFSSRLVDKANYAGGLDNISVVLVHVY